MQKVNSKALLSVLALATSLGVMSQEAHGTTVTSVVNTIAKEALPNNIPLPTPLVTPSVNYPSGGTVTLTLNGASFINGNSYSILGNGGYVACSGQATSSGQNSLSLNCNSLTANTSYSVVGGGSNALFIVNGSQGANSIVLSYSSNVSNDTPSSATLAQIQQQLTVTPANTVTATIDPSSLSTFTGGSNYASNSITISSSTGFNIAIGSDILNVVFNGIPNSVSAINTTFTGANDTASSNYTQGAGSATVSLTLPSNGAVFSSPHSDTASFSFINTGNIQTGTIYISSITGTQGNYSYFSGSQNFLSFSLGGTQIYIPDALAHSGSNVIQYGYITITMPTSASIASISVLDNPSASCPIPSTSNGLLQSTSSTGVYYISLNQLAQACTGISQTAWQSGVPLVIYISGPNASPNNITADAYAVFFNMLKRIPVNVISIGSGTANFSY